MADIIVGFGYGGHRAWEKFAPTETGRDLRYLGRHIKEAGKVVHDNIIPRAVLSLTGTALYSGLWWLPTFPYSLVAKAYNAAWGTQHGGPNAANRHWYTHLKRPHVSDTPVHVAAGIWNGMDDLVHHWEAPDKPEAPVVAGDEFDKDRVYKAGQENTPSVRKQYNEWMTKRMLKNPDKLYNWVRSATNDGLPMALNAGNAKFPHLLEFFAPADASTHPVMLAVATAEFQAAGTGIAVAVAASRKIERGLGVAADGTGVPITQIDVDRSDDKTLAVNVNDVINNPVRGPQVLQRHAELAAARAVVAAMADATLAPNDAINAGLQAAADNHPDLTYTAPAAGALGVLASGSGDNVLLAAITTAINSPDAIATAADQADEIRHGHMDKLLLLPSETANNLLQMKLERDVAEYTLQIELKMANRDIWIAAMYAHLGIQYNSANNEQAEDLRSRRTAGLVETDPIWSRTQGSTAPTPHKT